MVRITVRASSPYDIIIEPGLLTRAAEPLDLTPQQICIVSDPSIYGIYGKVLTERLRNTGAKAIWPHIIPEGEPSKNLGVLSRIFDALAEHRFERADLLVALGGGVVGDVTGFAAATYLRGLPYIQVPSSLLAQVDSSVGGKTGVDHAAGKNLIGAFYQPRMVWIDPHMLRTLPLNQRKAGLAEVIKYGVIADADFFTWLEDQIDVLSRDVVRDDDWSVWQQLIQRCCEIKAVVVQDDEKELSGRRAILNFGHTFGHAFETLYGYKQLLHGEAIAVGMRAAGRLAVALGMFPHLDQQRLEDLLDAVGLPDTVSRLDVKDVLRCMRSDKKVQGGKIRLALPIRLGAVELRHDFSTDQLSAAVESVLTKAAVLKS